jgi:large subunit ribosomal protein L22
MEKKFISTQKFVIVSPRKLREVVSMVKGIKRAVEVVDRLPFTNKLAHLPLMKVIETAISNAKLAGVNPENLVLDEVMIGEGPRLKRYRAGSRGRAKPYKRRMSHIRVVLKVDKASMKSEEDLGELKKNTDTKKKRDAIKTQKK